MASMSISDLQYGHFFVVGAAGSSFFLNLLMNLRRINRTSAVKINVITALMKLPIANPAIVHDAKSDDGIRRPNIGVKMSSTNEVTIAVKAEPIIMPTAISTMLPFAMKSLNSFKNFFIMLLSYGLII